MAFIVDFGLLYVLTEFFGVWYLLSTTFAVMVAMVVNYSWQRFVTFKSLEETHVKQFSKFVSVSLVAITINVLLMYALVDGLGVWYLLAKIFVTAIVLFFNFFANKHYTFNPSPRNHS